MSRNTQGVRLIRLDDTDRLVLRTGDAEEVPMTLPPTLALGTLDVPHSNIEKFSALPINDAQTQVAQFITGNIDLVRDLPPDQARDLIKDKKFALTVSDGVVSPACDVHPSAPEGSPAMAAEPSPLEAVAVAPAAADATSVP